MKALRFLWCRLVVAHRRAELERVLMRAPYSAAVSPFRMRLWNAETRLARILAGR